MIRELSIQNFRGFERFEMRDLGRVNLLVGTNNSGKTSLLEAIELLHSHGNLDYLWLIPSRRGEQTWDEFASRETLEVEPRHLFHRHELMAGAWFRLEGTGDGTPRSLTVRVHNDSERPDRQPPPTDSFLGNGKVIGPLALNVVCEAPNIKFDAWFSLDRRGSLPSRAYDAVADRQTFRNGGSWPNARFVGTTSLSANDIVRLFDDLVLTPEEPRLIEALNTIEPTIERLAAVGPGRRGNLGPRSGMLVKRRDLDLPLPIGSMGDGIWRMLGLALALVHAKDGILLVDEIDTGLHYSVMEDMWRLVQKTAERLNVQVFATTHSRDCYESLAAIARTGVLENSEVTIQRIEPAKGRAVAYSEAEIYQASLRGVEVR